MQQENLHNKNFNVQVVRPAGVYYQNSVSELVFPAQDGLRSILYEHAPFLSTIGIGILQVHKAEGPWDYFYVRHGMLHVHQNHVAILTESILSPKDVSYEKTSQELKSKQETSISQNYSAEQKAKDIQHLTYQLQLLEMAQTQLSANLHAVDANQ